MAPIVSVGAIAIASRGANAVGAVRLTCGPERLEIELVRAGGFAAGFTPAAIAEAVTFAVPYSAVRGLVRRGRTLGLALDPLVARPYSRFTLTRFSEDPAAALVGAYRARVWTRALAVLLPGPLALAAMRVAPDALVSGALGTLSLGAVVCATSFALLRELAEWIAWGGPASDRFRDALERELSRRLGLVPAVVHAGAPVDEPLRPEPDAAPRWRVAAIVAAAAAALVGVLAFVQRFSGDVALPPVVPRAEAGLAARARRAAGSEVGTPPSRCSCARADSPLWRGGLPALTVITASRDGVEEIAPHEEPSGAKRYDFDLVAVNDAARPLEDVRIVVTFARRDKRGRRVGATDRGFFAAKLGPGRAVRWRVRGPGTELRIDGPGSAKLGEGEAADADAFFSLLSARQPALRLHAAMMLAYLRDPRALDAAGSLTTSSAPAERTRAAIVRAAAPVFACELAQRDDVLEACVVNEGSAVARGLEAREVIEPSELAASPGRAWQLAIDVPVHDGVRVSLPSAADFHGELSVGFGASIKGIP